LDSTGYIERQEVDWLFLSVNANSGPFCFFAMIIYNANSGFYICDVGNLAAFWRNIGVNMAGPLKGNILRA